ncbi:PEP/pyruvate-binding domain-containing protein [uncultured Alsobacter sp.]|uniref:PEP/pyruvate-binding domain-containing protein n=1 Tax=uncultured Alsobacter sp. TaxID=1748258 RepID=UPI0025EB8665|nr:PEP/pyruvate-binding domain-containing protein [uncultured Alsobacter sp.]
MAVVALREAVDVSVFGGKAVQLGTALRADLPVPDGHAIAAPAVEAIVRGDRSLEDRFLQVACAMDGPVAVRSSAIGEDSAEASFAGQHATKLAVRGAEAALAALREVWESGRTESALAYRRRIGAGEEPQVAVVLQRLVPADVSGVLFTCDPVTGADEIVIEAGWGLGEGVVQGLVVPDRFRMSLDGQVKERTPGMKPTAVRMAEDGGTTTETLPAPLARRLCLGYPELRKLHALAMRCDAVYGAGPHDIEWAIQDGTLFLLQRRPVTRRGGVG